MLSATEGSSGKRLRLSLRSRGPAHSAAPTPCSRTWAWAETRILTWQVRALVSASLTSHQATAMPLARGPHCLCGCPRPSQSDTAAARCGWLPGTGMGPIRNETRQKHKSRVRL